MCPAVIEVTLGAGALPKEVSMGLLGLAERLDRWTVFQGESHDCEAGRCSKPPAVAPLVGVSLSLWSICCKVFLALCLPLGPMNLCSQQ